MRSMELPEDIKLPEYEILEVKGINQTRRVALIGLNTEDPMIYRPGSFGGCTIEPILPKARELYEKLREYERVDAVIPLTHQDIPLDRELAETGLFPVIIGGHDHDPYLENIRNCTVVKSGINGHLISICSLTWEDAQTSDPVVTVEVREAMSYDAKPEVREAVKEHLKLLDELNNSSLCKIPVGFELSSVNTRYQPTSLGTFLCSTLKDALGSDVVLLAGGNVRANRSYVEEKSFSYAHLKSEMPFSNEMVQIHLPGRVISDMITHSRALSLRSPPEENPGYIQADKGMLWNRSTNSVRKINNAPVDLTKMYRVELPWVMLNGLDDITPLLMYKEAVKDTPFNIDRTEESGIPAKDVIVAHFSRMLLFQMVHSEKFSDIDVDGDGEISREEFRHLAKKKFGADGMSEMVVDNMFSIADKDGSGSISRQELLSVFTSSMEAVVLLHSIINSESFVEIDKDNDGLISREEFRMQAKKKFELSDAMIDMVFNMADKDGSGSIDKIELENVMKSLDIFARENNSSSEGTGAEKGEPMIIVEEVSRLMREELGDDFDLENVKEELDKLDEDKSGSISLKEFADFRNSQIRRVANVKIKL
eukprot:CAMPEP_0182424222 /NCGR_PEP_ID=MMETSP1167-20130531/10384_1 /TAXON_ID=2988 /ORGANISM="Mallomonas Sp, Strain CCMP3275" /LENGTH=594 /DNA_ID=CAMNT_0024603845 /DNA_START=458 /DNA_END=2242 /DNA_ORIENTATION=+